MSSAREKFRQRFATNRPDTVPVDRSEARRQRRKDFKGSRRRLNLRLDEGVAFDLDVLQLVQGIEKNAFCEAVIREAVTSKIEALQKELGTESWEEIVHRAKGTTKI